MHYSNTIYRTHPQRNTKGFSLVELLVAMVISLFLIGGVVQLFIQNKTSYKLQEGIARAQENGRIALYFIEKHLRRAAYPLDSLPAINGFAKDEVASPDFSPTQSMPTDSTTDTLVMQLQAPSSGLTDCTGRFVDADEHVAMYFYLDSNTLYCQSVTTASSTLSTAPLIDGITDLQFTYGVDTDDDGIPNGDYVVASGSVDWEQVVAVQVNIDIPVEPAALSNSSTKTFTATVPIRNQINRVE